MVKSQMSSGESVLKTLENSSKEPICLIRGFYSNVAERLLAT
jgi:hypothetical protein